MFGFVRRWLGLEVVQPEVWGLTRKGYEYVASKRGTENFPCKECGNEETGSTLIDGWYRCNNCGYPGK